MSVKATLKHAANLARKAEKAAFSAPIHPRLGGATAACAAAGAAAWGAASAAASSSAARALSGGLESI